MIIDRKEFSSSIHESSWILFIITILTIGFSPSKVLGFEGLDKTSQNFLKSYCIRCHNESKQKGNFRLDTLEVDFTNPIIAQKWDEVVFRINAGEMPPEDEKQPSATEIGNLADHLVEKIREGAAARMAKRGKIQQYRLSRKEYAHTVYDLLGVVFDVEAPGAFNEDPRWHGFERIGSLLSTAPSHIDRYLRAADRVIELASLDNEPTSRKDRKYPDEEGKRYYAQLGEGWDAVNLKSPGHYRIKIRLSGLPAFTGRIPRVSLWHHQYKRSVVGMDISTTEDQPETILFEGLFNAGSYKILNNAQTKKHANGGVIRFRQGIIDAGQKLASLKGGFRSDKTKIVDEQGVPVVPTLLMDWVEVEGPITTEATRKKRFGILPNNEEDIEEISECLQRFAERALRRPVMDSEIERYIEFINHEKEAGVDFRSAYKSALSGILVSRNFFNIEEGSPNENRTHLNNFELASRLSYFLWSSMPDDQLFATARSGKLNDPKMLSKEIKRMIADPKIDRFLDSFPRQWLQLHRVGMFQPDPNIYPEYGPWLEESMILETMKYFSEMFHKNLSIREFIDSDWTMLNSKLATHYGLKKPNNSGFTRVKLKPESGRGGLLTHASILSLTSDGTRHRPVHRGAWLSEVILGHTPPPPPPNVDPLEPVKTNQPKTTIRSQLEAHTTDANCASCHSKIDPLGLAFENFDAIGRWRLRERVEAGTGENPLVDASGTLPDGKVFDGPEQFKKLLAGNDKKLAEAFIKNLSTYALRRLITVDDKPYIKKILETSASKDYQLKSILQSVAESELFRRR